MDVRPLTPGEIAFARTIFGDAIDYGRVRLFRGKWWPLQPRGTAMAPTGNIHFHPNGGGWSDRISRPSRSDNRPISCTSSTHVWQAQTKGRFYLPLMRHPFCRYHYELKPGQPFGRYGLEQQAEIVKDAFLASRGCLVRCSPPRSLLPFG